MKEKLDKIINGKFGGCVERFFGSIAYIIVAGAIGIVCHTLEQPMIGTFAWTVLLVLMFVFCKDMFALVPFVCMCTFILSFDTMPQSGYFDAPIRRFALIVELAVILAALVFSLTYNKRWGLIFKKGYLTASLCFVTAVLLMGGLGAERYSALGVLIGLGVAATMFLPYSLILNCGKYEGQKTVKYFAWTATVAAFVIGWFVLNVYLRKEPDFFYAPKTFLMFGFAGPNTGAAYVVIALPLTFYLIYAYRHGYLLLPLAFLEETIVVAMFSRASLIPITLLLIALSVGVGIKLGSKKRIAYLVTLVACIFVIALILKLRWAEFNEHFLGSLDADDSGRFALWQLGIDEWKQTPIFGIGITFLPDKGFPYYSFHNTPLTFLCCCGAVGLAAYLYHRGRTVSLLFSARLTAERVFVALSALGMIVNALLDIGMTYPQLLLYYSVMLAICELDVRHTKESLPRLKRN